MASFDIFLPILLGFEGGFVNNPHDPGGATNKGITIKVFQQCSHTLLGIDPTLDNLTTLTDAQAGLIYKPLYWNKVQGDNITFQDLANIVADFYVNAGSHASTLLQQIIVANGANIVIDGGIGPATIAALSTMDPIDVYAKYKAGRIAYYTQLGATFPQFLKGWLNRVNTFPDLP